MRDLDLGDIVLYVLFAFLFAVIGFAVFAVITSVFTPIACNNITADIGLPHQWTFLGGCRVFDGGHWMPLENWRYIGESLK